MADEKSSTGTSLKSRPWTADVFFEALSNPMRRKLLIVLATQGMKTSAELNPGGFRRPAVLKQLAVLCEAGLVVQKENKADRRQCFYALAPQAVVCAGETGKIIDFGCATFRLPMPGAN